MTGDVQDLSSGGMRVKSAERPPAKAGGTATFTLRIGAKTLSVQGKVAWIKRASLLAGPYEYGVQFVAVTGAVGKVLEQIAMYGFVHDGQNNGGKSESKIPGWRPSGATGTASEKGEAGPARPKVIVTADLPCFYETLGVGADATQDQIRSAFRTLAKKLHPDVCKEPEAGERFTFITRVYEVLSDPELRARYDEAMANRRAA